jgi:Uma2 family endonuclease
MRVTLRLERRATYAEYLSVQADTPHRLEFIDGVIVAMAGGSDEHNAVAGRFAGLLGARRSASCRYYTPDQKFWIAATTRARYSDGSIICGTLEHPPHDRHATTNPAIILEVLSPSSEGDDEGDKRQDFESLATLQAYVVAHQDERTIRVYRRASDGSWGRVPETYRDGQSFELPTLVSSIAVDDVYAGILDPEGRSLLVPAG